jgi:hypothetical protein
MIRALTYPEPLRPPRPVAGQKIEGGIRFLERDLNPELTQYGARCNKILNKEHFFLKTANETPTVD